MYSSVSSGQNAKEVVNNMNQQKASSSSSAKTTTQTSTQATTQTTTPKPITQTTTQTATNNNVGNWSYGSDTEERQNEIRTNLDNAYAKNPTQFSSWDAFANAFNYNYS
jgi:heterodisulfide reductase subunit B